MNLQQIIAGCIQHDRNCQKQLYDQCYSYGMKVTITYCKDIEEAREVLNDAFIKMFTNIHQYDQGQPFLAWFRIIIIRTAINHFHSIKNNIKSQELTQDIQTEVSQDDNALSQLDANELLCLVNQLPTSYKLVINLYAIEGYTHKEIAELLSITEGTSKSNLSKARVFLSKLIAKTKFLILF